MANGTKSKKKVVILVTILVVIVTLILFAIFNKKDSGIPVTIEKVTKKSITQVVTASGKIYPTVEVKISPDVSGEIIDLAIVEGQEVKKGQFLARIKPDNYEFQKKQSEATVSSARNSSESARLQFERTQNEFNRVSDLYKKKLISDTEFEASRTSFQVAQQTLQASESDIKRAQANLDLAIENLNKTSIYSPINGIVSKLMVEKGERVVGTSQFSGTEMMRVADFGLMEVRVNVNENDVVNVNIGDTTRIVVDAFKGRTFVGIVTEISRSPVTTGLGTSEEVTNFPVKIKVINPDKAFRSGLSATVDIETDRALDVWAVPIQSVTIRQDAIATPGTSQEGGQGEAMQSTKPERAVKDGKKDPDKIVFVVENGVAKSLIVSTGISDNQFIHITSGLTGEESIVIGSYRAIAKELSDGKKVIVEDSKKNQLPNASDEKK